MLLVASEKNLSIARLYGRQTNSRRGNQTVGGGPGGKFTDRCSSESISALPTGPLPHVRPLGSSVSPHPPSKCEKWHHNAVLSDPNPLLENSNHAHRPIHKLFHLPPPPLVAPHRSSAAAPHLHLRPSPHPHPKTHPRPNAHTHPPRLPPTLPLRRPHLHIPARRLRVLLRSATPLLTLPARLPPNQPQQSPTNPPLQNPRTPPLHRRPRHRLRPARARIHPPPEQLGRRPRSRPRRRARRADPRAV